MVSFENLLSSLLSNSEKINLLFIFVFYNSNNRKLQNCTIKYLNYDKIFLNTINTYLKKL